MLVVADGEIDLGSAAQLHSVLAPIADAPGGDVVLDLSEVSFLDSNALAVLLDAQDRLAGARRSLRLRQVRAQQRRLFDVAGVAGRVVFEDGDPPHGTVLPS